MHTFKIAAKLAWRYLTHRPSESSLSTMIKVCLFTIALASCSLLLVLAIMTGFEQATHSQLQGIHSDLIMQAPHKEPLNIDKLQEILSKEFPEVIGLSPQATSYALIKASSDAAASIVMIKGIYPELEEKSTQLNKQIIIPRGISLQQLIHDNTIIIGKTLAQMLNAGPGDSLELFFPAESQHSASSIKLDKTTVKIVGIFKTGIEDYDESVIIAHHNFLDSFFDVQPSSIGLKIQPNATIEDLEKKLAMRFNLFVYSWKDLYPALVCALKLEKYASILILALIILIASMTIIAVLFMQITHKRKDIAILQAMGASASLIRQIFIIMGIFMAGVGSLIGIGIGTGISYFLKRYPLIQLPEAYYADHLPILLTPEMIALVFVFIMLISLIAIIWATRSLKKINCIEILKFEA